MCQRARNTIMLDRELNPPRLWSGHPSGLFAKASQSQRHLTSLIQTYADQRITHDDFTNAIESHPCLPIYLTGNSRGLVCMWNFAQVQDKSLSQWILDKETPAA